MRSVCKCGCKTPLSGRQELWATDACRKAFKRRRRRRRADRARTRATEQPRMRLDLVLEAAREAHAGRDPEECVLERLTDAQRHQREQLAQRSKEAA